LRDGASDCIVDAGDRVPAKIDLSAATVLTLDDDASMRAIVREALKVCGCRNILATGDGRAALDMLDHQRIDLAICDMQMDAMDGLTFMRRARDHRRGRDMTAIMLTAGKQPADTAALEPLRIGAWLFKPISISKLLDGLGQVTGSVMAQGASDQAARDLEAIGRRYAARLNDDITYLETLLATAPEDPEALREIWRAMRKSLHDLKGQAGTFGYALVTDLAVRAQDVLDGALAVAPAQQDCIKVNRILRAIFTAMRMLERGRMLGDGGNAGTVLLEKLDGFILSAH
jgi:two-component system, chemotaxis family, chemotaxis protein CheY